MKRPNIVLAVIDTLRFDHVSAYGYGRPTTPTIDRLAQEGTLYEDAVVTNFPTGPSFTALYTGREGVDTGVVRHGASPHLSAKVPMFTEALRQVGYTTCAVDNIVTLMQGLPGWFSRGYDYYVGFRFEKPFRAQSRFNTSRAMALVNHVADDSPFFLMVHYWDPHAPYLPHEDIKQFDQPRTIDGAEPIVQRFARVGDQFHEHTLRSMKMDDVSNYDYILGRYDAEAFNSDRQLGRLVQHLERRGILDDTLLIVMSDHGECFGEFGAHFQHHGPSEANLHVPFVMRWPGKIAAGKREPRLVASVDVTATILEAAGATMPGVTGRTLLSPTPHREHAILAECTGQANWVVRTPTRKLVVPARDPKTGEFQLDHAGKPRSGPSLHRVERGMSIEAEEEDLSAKEPAVRAELEGVLRRFLDERLRGRPDPLELGPSRPPSVAMQMATAYKNAAHGGVRPPPPVEGIED